MTAREGRRSRSRSVGRQNGKRGSRRSSKERGRSRDRDRGERDPFGKYLERCNELDREKALAGDQGDDQRSVSYTESTATRDKRKRKEAQSWTGKPGDSIDNGRYLVQKHLGQGTFAKVFQCKDTKYPNAKRVAIKIIRADKRYEKAARDELRVLKDVEKAGGDRHGCIGVLRTFAEEAQAGLTAPHTCIVFPQYGPSIFSFMDRNQKKSGTGGFSSETLRAFSYYIINSMHFLHKYNIIHTDLKPENILLKSDKFLELPDGYRIPLSPDIVIIDFGSAQYDHEEKGQTIQTRHYRAPEVVLDLGWSCPADMWSVGCMLVEFGSGECMFMTHSNEEHLAMMEQVFQRQLPNSMIERSRTRGMPFYSRDLKLKWPPPGASKSDLEFVRALPPLEAQCSRMYDKVSRRNDFYELIARLLVYDPAERMTAREALRAAKFIRMGRWGDDE